ncbi:MAG: HOOK protein [Rhodobacteraceae bacterium HLUCCO07]|nr:MAG: HOOK protein [Rhodobacteraceae bacterium HLUCCO07]
MESMRSVPGDAESEAFGFAAHLLGPDGSGTQMPVGVSELAGHLERSGTQGIIIYEDPSTVIAHLLESGRPLNKALAQWRAVAQEHLALCRKSGRRIALCGTTQDSAEAVILSEQLSERFAKTKLPGLSTAVSPPDPFFVALAALSAGRDSVTRDMIEELLARSIVPPVSPVNLSVDDPESSLETLLGRWNSAHTEFGSQVVDLNGQVAQLEKTLHETSESLEETRKALGSAEGSLAKKISALNSQGQEIANLIKERDTAQTAEEKQSRTAVLLNHQVSELEAALKSRVDEVIRLNADRKALVETHEKKVSELEAALKSRADEVTRLNADRTALLEKHEKKVTELERSLNRARQSLDGTEAALAENERLQSQIDEIYASTSWRITMPMRSIKRLFVGI